MTAVASGTPPIDRRVLATSFGRAADSYDRFRPDYPPAAVTAAVNHAQQVLDLGAGTGKLTRLLPAAGVQHVWAVEPDRQMRGVLTAASPNATVLPGSAEQIPLPDATVDAVVVGQALHWCDLDRALPEIARVLLPGGHLTCLWNTADVRDAFTRQWVQALATVLPNDEASGGSPASDETPDPPFAGTEHFDDPGVQLFEWRHRMTAEQLHGLADTYSTVLTAEASCRDDLHRQLTELIGDRATVAVAERCQVWTAVRR